MRIFYAADDTTNLDVSSKMWYYNLYCPLVDLGHEVIRFDYDIGCIFRDMVDKKIWPAPGMSQDRRRDLSQRLLSQVQKEHAKSPIDLFFSYFYDAFVLPEAIDSIKAMGITTMNWYCNASYQFDMVRCISPHYDYCLVPEGFRIEDYKAIGATPIYCQEAANPNVYKSLGINRDIDVSFVGQAYGERFDIVYYLFENEIPVHLWGPAWVYYKEHASRGIKKWVKSLLGSSNRETSRRFIPDDYVGGILTDEAMIRTFNRSKINLGFSAVGDGLKERILQIRLRDFEVPMSGGFYMVEYFSELEFFFKVGEEIVCYENKGDLCEKIKYYLKHEDEREYIRDAGHKRALKDHTWHKRFQMVFKEIGLE